MEERGTISIHTENIFPIIKKFLYSDHEIFLRELISNAVDATEKLKRLSAIGEAKDEMGDLKIHVAVNKDAKTITVKDKGIGMTADEIKKYINQIAFSGATEFIEKYKDKIDEKQIIGHFGLGFYSAFMVSSKVEIITKSFKEGSEAARWICDGSTEFEITKAEKQDRGTDIILHLADDSLEFLENYRIENILTKYCKFLPVEIEFEGKIINNTNPLWTRQPSELKDEDYLNFYRELYPFAGDPLFWIHLNVDYPFNLTGILYFPKLKGELEVNKNKIQLYSRQVFITDEVKDVVPEFLMLLHGVIDSPDIPLNVSRSFLQTDSNVKKINTHITKKVADKLAELFKNDRKAFEEKWNDIHVFVKFGMMSDDKFYEKAKDFCLLSNIKDQHYTIEEYKEFIKANQTDKNETIIALYTSDPARQHSYIESAEKRNYDVLLMNNMIDNHFINMIEGKVEKFALKRVDADIVDKLIDKGHQVESVLSENEKTKVKEIFEKATTGKGVTLNLESLPADELPVSITQPEFMRRMKEMSSLGGGGFMGKMPEILNVAINTNHKIIQKLLKAPNEEEQVKIAKQAYDLGLLSQGMLSGKELTDFIQRSAELASN
ncbi:MAG: molecular chaperone HtpG [Cytophagaceae bacterium]|nr:molecular chaperone HtpG [Cytophagaceae bacterium]